MKVMNQKEREKFIAEKKLTAEQLDIYTKTIAINSSGGVTNIPSDILEKIIGHGAALEMELEDAEHALSEEEVSAHKANGTADFHRKISEQLQESLRSHQQVGMFAASALTGILSNTVLTTAIAKSCSADSTAFAETASRRAFTIGRAMAEEYHRTMPQPEPECPINDVGEKALETDPGIEVVIDGATTQKPGFHEWMNAKGYRLNHISGPTGGKITISNPKLPAKLDGGTL